MEQWEQVLIVLNQAGTEIYNGSVTMLLPTKTKHYTKVLEGDGETTEFDLDFVQ